MEQRLLRPHLSPAIPSGGRKPNAQLQLPVLWRRECHREGGKGVKSKVAYRPSKKFSICAELRRPKLGGTLSRQRESRRKKRKGKEMKRRERKGAEGGEEEGKGRKRGWRGEKKESNLEDRSYEKEQKTIPYNCFKLD